MGEAESWDANILNPEEVPQDLIEYIKKAQNKIRFDVLFSWVCNKWRCIAISITALWSKIDFRGRPPYDCAQEYIRRSKPSSLSVYFNSQRHKSSLSESQNMDKALELISNNVDRVKSLVVEVTSTSELVKVLRTFCQASSPVPLESLQLARYNMIGRGISGGETAPRLGYIKQLMQGIRHIRLVNVNIPWDDVTHRSLSSLRLAHLSHHSNGPSINNLRSVIAGSPRLESLALEDVRISDKFIVNQVAPTPITLPFLHTLQLKQLSNGGDHFVLATLIAPNLVRLTLHDLPSQDLNNVLPDFVRGLQTIESGAVISSCRVEYLQLCNCKLESTVVEGMLASLPNLLEIYFHSMDCVTDSLFSSLIISDQEVTDSNACKKLQILRVVDCSHFTMAEVLKQAITSRQGMLQDSGVEELKRLDVKWCPMANEFENKEWFKQNVKTVFWKIDEQV
ncbi:hypothetical protein FRC03_012281 [Tulasnella sp. 419]|nr:hypothetical protein FRC03_012281 [Tulasnella sp. 419]